MKGSLLELVDGLLDAIDQLANEWPGIEARDLSARLNRNPVGLLFNATGPESKLLSGVRIGLRIADVARHGDGKVLGQSDLAQHHREQRAVDTLEMLDDFRADTVARQSEGLPGEQHVGRNPQRRLQQVDPRLSTDHPVPSPAEA